MCRKPWQKLYAEYNIPVVSGLVVSAGVEHYGRQAVNQPNTTFIPGYSVFDAGARYSFTRGATRRRCGANIYNLGDKRYWANPNFLGSPLEALFSIPGAALTCCCAEQRTWRRRYRHALAGM